MVVTECFSPLIKYCSPLIKYCSPLIKCYSPLIKCSSPLIKCSSPLVRCSSPLIKCSSPLIIIPKAPKMKIIESVKSIPYLFSYKRGFSSLQYDFLWNFAIIQVLPFPNNPKDLDSRFWNCFWRNKNCLTTGCLITSCFITAEIR